MIANTVWKIATTSLKMSVTMVATCGKSRCTVSTNVLMPMPMLAIAKTTAPPIRIIFAIGATSATNAAMSAPPITAASVPRMGSRLVMMNVVIGRSIAEISRPLPTN